MVRLSLLILLLNVSRLSAADVSFQRDIRPILANACFRCHGPDVRKAGLDLQSFVSATKKLPSGESAILPGNSAKSELIRRITSHNAEDQMPPKGERLRAEQITKLRDWIDRGAKYEEHWAYVAPKNPPLPKVSRPEWVRNPIDAFVMSRLDQEKLSPSPEAPREILIRRVTLDLTGLPPSPQLVDAFLKDTRPDAYERMVDEVLASKHYGEHLARWWLDLGRYADTNGYEKDGRRTIWPWRDWVISAFNRDLPFDQFTIEQLAGDLLPKATIEQKVATGFHRNTMVNTEGGTDDEEFRVAAVVDRVNTTLTVWMGMTIGCAQCHNHKYDPITQKEYFQFFAYFNGSKDQGRSTAPEIPVPTEEEAERRAKVGQRMARNAVTLFQSSPLATAAALRPVLDSIDSLKKLEGGIKPATSLVMQELPKIRPTFVHVRGNFKSPGDAVVPAVPGKLHPVTDPAANRLALARWLIDPANPLTGRVTMNRIWARFFGRGIVETSDDFGIQGDLPTHPELLDFLATEFYQKKLSLKQMQKLIVMSATYRQTSRVSKQLYEVDPFNRLFARGPRFRLEAETVRDNALAISGLLNRKIGGPSVMPFQPEGVWANPYSGDRWVLSSGGDQHRRGMYTFWRRTAPYASFMAFDAPSREIVCERRPRSNTPLQALATLNDRSFVECAAGLARRSLTEVSGDDTARLDYAFRLCVVRPPTEAEQEALRTLLKESREKFSSNPAGATQLSGMFGPLPAKVEAAEMAAWMVVANVLLNLDETITRE